ENLSDDILVMIIEDKDETLKEELRSVVSSAGHRIGIINAYRIKSELAKKVTKCTLCSLNLNLNWKSLWTHLKCSHKFNARCRKFSCPVCNSEFTWYNSYRRHFQLHESSPKTSVSEHERSIQKSKEFVGSNENEEETENTDESKLPESAENLIRNLEREAAIYTVKLHSSGKIPRSVIAEIISWTKDIVEKIVEICIAEQESLNEDSVLLNKLKNPFFKVETQYKLDKYLKDNGFYVEPEEIVLGTYHKITNINNVTITKLAKDTLEYVPIFPLLKKVLELPGVLANSFEVSSRLRNNSESICYSGPMCGNY
ncbi:unnamed protein product, partial [Allacma fusca]